MRRGATLNNSTTGETQGRPTVSQANVSKEFSVGFYLTVHPLASTAARGTKQGRKAIAAAGLPTLLCKDTDTDRQLVIALRGSLQAERR